MQVGPPPAANTNTASRLPAPFSSLPYIPARPAPSRAAQPASLGLPDAGRAGGPRLASARRTPLRPQLGAGQPTGRPSHTRPGPVAAPCLAHPPRGHEQLPGLCVSCSPRPRPPSSSGVGASKEASVQPRKPCARPRAPDSASCRRHLLPGVHAGQPQGHGQAVVVDSGHKRGPAELQGEGGRGSVSSSVDGARR